MRSFKITENDAGQRVDRFLRKAIPTLPDSLAQRYIRIKRIKVNGARCKSNQQLLAGDLLEAYINDEFFDNTKDSSFMESSGLPSVVYEDEHLLILNKPAGQLAHEGGGAETGTLVGQIKKYLFDKGEYDPVKENSFTPSLCNRIDRGTAGIVIAAKDAPTLRVINSLIRERQIDKFYLAAAYGRLSPSEATLKAYLVKDAKMAKVQIFDTPLPGALTILTGYKTIRSSRSASLLEVELLTGRTHQIRAHLAHVGHPLLGDSKYGKNTVNRAAGLRRQALLSYKLRFQSDAPLEHLGYLAGRSFELDKTDFIKLFDSARERLGK